jgi:P27 family predicted phage terminase small subunit
VGGRGSGGSRVGAGRRPKDADLHALHGTAKRPRRQRRKKRTPSLPLVGDLKQPPTWLPDDQKTVWTRLAPHAVLTGTLTEATAHAFRDLCEAMVMKKELHDDIKLEGYTVMTESGVKANPLLTHYRGMMQRVEAGLARFMLTPQGKPLGGDDEEADDPFNEFDNPGGSPVQH